MQIIKIVFLSSLSLLISHLTLKAHATDQITYIFDQEAALLTIHLTPKGAIDLIEVAQPELLQEEVLYLNNYHELYANYFNNTIDFKVDNKAVNLLFAKSDLNQHDAVLQFTLEGFEGSIKDFNLSISSFTEVYRRVQNHVFINTHLGQRQFLLTKTNQVCSIETLETQNLPPLSSNSTVLSNAINNYFWIGGILILGLGVLLIVFQIKIFKGSGKAYFS